MAYSLTNNLYTSDLYTGDQTRELDRRAIHDHGIPGLTLMKRAGLAAFERACVLWPDNRHWLVLCGGGNNAGDGYAFAALAAQRGHRVEVLFMAAPDQLSGDALTACEEARQQSVPMRPFDTDAVPPQQAVLVDALLGIGLRTPVRDSVAAAIHWINASGLPVLALDLPSGLCADSGSELGCAVRATHTLSFITAKVGLYTGRGPALCGQVAVATLEVPQEAFTGITAAARRVALPVLLPLLSERAEDIHKGALGHLMVIGGDLGYGGAAILAAEAAAMTGAGLVTLATRPEHVTAALVRRPELMVIGVPSGQELEPHMARPDVLVVGPGLGRTPWSEQLLQQALQSGQPVVLDADALNILAEGRLPLPDHQQWVMTPHPGEAARLLKSTTQEVQNDRVGAVTKLQKAFGGVILLKGAGTLIADASGVYLAKVGNPGLATAGSGDVLAGLIGSLMAQGLAPLIAAQLGVCLHGEAADLAVEETGLAGLQAAELVPYVRELLKT